MTTLYHPFELKCFADIKNYVTEYMAQFNTENIYIKNLIPPQTIIDQFNQEMKDYDLGTAWNFLCFKRKNFFVETYNVHVDFSKNDSVVHSSIVVPIEGCSDTHMYWTSGEYELKQHHLPNQQSTYAVPIWKNTPSIIGRVEINTCPTLVRVDVPHSVTSRKDGSYRTILSIRLNDNPSFDEVLSKYLCSSTDRTVLS